MATIILEISETYKITHCMADERKSIYENVLGVVRNILIYEEVRLTQLSWSNLKIHVYKNYKILST